MKKKERRRLRTAETTGVVPQEVKQKLMEAAVIAGAIHTYVMLDDLGEITVEEVGLVTEALRKELDDLRHLAGFVR